MQSHSWTKHIDFMLLDIVCMNIAFFIAYFIRFSSSDILYDSTHRGIFVIYTLALIIACFAIDSLSDVLKRGFLVELIMVLEQTVLTLAIVTLVLFAGHIGNSVSRIAVILAAVIYAVIDYAVRILWKLYLRAYRKTKPAVANLRTAFIVSDSGIYSELSEKINNNIWNDFRLCGICLCDGNDMNAAEYSGVPVINNLDEAAHFICREWVDDVFLFMPGSSKEISTFMNRCREMGIQLHYVLNIETVNTSKQFVENIGDYSVVTTAFSYLSPRQRLFKRSCDIIISLFGCLLTLVIGLVIGPIIYINSPGPIIFKQRRVGKNGKIFSVYKFRSMYLDAEERKKELITDNRIADGMMFKLDFDPRIIGNRMLPDGTKKTGIGEFIRKTSLDEFPQFFNVLKGDMSIVGTRPPTIDEWDKYEYHHRARLAIKPGITGLWQVSGRSEITDFEEVVRLDTEYIANYRISLDIKIFFKTIIVLLKRKGAM